MITALGVFLSSCFGSFSTLFIRTAWDYGRYLLLLSMATLGAKGMMIALLTSSFVSP